MTAVPLPVDSPFEVFSQLLVEETKALLDRHGAACADHAAGRRPAEGRRIVASIGQSGRYARGALTLVAEPDVWRAISESPTSGAQPEAMLSDFAGEVANMLMGRLRNRLLRFGLEVHQATPTCAFGAAVVLSDPGDAQSIWHVFTIAAGELHARLDVHLEPGLVLRPDSEDAIQPCESALVLL